MLEKSENRIAMITGAAGGIGACVSEALVFSGHAIVAVDRDSQRLKSLAARFEGEKLSGRFLPIVSDITSNGECERIVRESILRFGRIDILFNNAGIGVSSIRADAESKHPTIDEITDDIWDRFFAINVRVPMVLTRAVIPDMRRRKWGRIINNTTSFRTMLRVLPYGATKASLEAMSAIWAKELSTTGVSVNVLVPGGATDTPLIANGSGWPRHELLSPKVMCRPICWLASRNSDGFTGRRIEACKWDENADPNDAAEKSSRAIGWPELAQPPKPWQA